VAHWADEKADETLLREFENIEYETRLRKFIAEALREARAEGYAAGKEELEEQLFSVYGIDVGRIQDAFEKAQGKGNGALDEIPEAYINKGGSGE